MHAGLPDVALRAQTTLAFSEKAAAPSSGVREGRYAVALALLGNYMVGSFATARGGQGGVVISGTSQAARDESPCPGLPTTASPRACQPATGAPPQPAVAVGRPRLAPPHATPGGW